MAPSPAPPPTFRTGAAVVLLDVVIRDKKGRPVPAIKPAEVEVFEDGVKQKVEGFLWVETEALPIESTAAPAPRVPDSARPLNLVSLVFDQLGPDGRRLAAKAATTFFEKGLRPNTWVAVFQIDQRLVLLQPFTNDAALLNLAQVHAGRAEFFAKRSGRSRSPLYRRLRQRHPRRRPDPAWVGRHACHRRFSMK